MTVGEGSDLVVSCISHFSCQNFIHLPVCMSGCPSACITTTCALSWKSCCGAPCLQGPSHLLFWKTGRQEFSVVGYFIFLCEFPCSTELRLSSGFYSALHMSVFPVPVMDYMRTYNMLTLLELRNKQQEMRTELWLSGDDAKV
jgi:hypothetical protein